MPLMVQILKNTELFSSFSEEELSLLLEFCEEQRVAKGTIIFTEAQKDDGAVYFVQEGIINIIKGSGADRLMLAMFGLGNIFGEMAFLDSGPRSASALADEDCILYKLTPEKFFEYGAKAPKAAMKMFKVFISKLVKRLRDTDEALVKKNQKIMLS